MANYLIVMSVDAMVFEDLEYCAALPHFQKLLAEGSRINRVRSIYPTLTHPIHVTVMTGCYPDKTGIYNNEKFEIGNLEPEWYNSLSDVKVETIFEAAKKAGLSTAASRWPVTANGNEYIDYLVPEIMDADLENGLEEAYQKLGSGPIMEEIIRPNLHLLDGNKRPGYDEFEIACAADIIKKHRPNLMFTHPGMVDSARHSTGLFTPKVKEALDLVDRWLGMLMDAAKEAGIYEDTSFVVLSDHGHLEIKRVICPNVVFADRGLIKTDEKGKILSWDAYIKSAALSGQVFLRDPEDKALKERVYTLLQEMCQEGIYGISRVFTKEEAEKAYHLSGPFSFVVESDGFSSLGDEWTRPMVRPFDLTDYKYGHSTHGHLPEKGPQPPFLCMGKGFRSGVVLEEGEIVDEGPTFAKILGLSLPEADGQAIEELLK